MASPAIFSRIPSTISTTRNHTVSPIIFTLKHTHKISQNSNRIVVRSSVSDSAIIDTPNLLSDSPEGENPMKIGARVRVKVPLIVYHIPKVSEVDLNGKEGVIKENIALWKGKHISANFAVKIEFLEVLEGRGDKPLKFFAHLREDEFGYIDCD